MLEEQDNGQAATGNSPQQRQQLISQSDLDAMLDSNDDILEEPIKLISDEQMKDYQDYNPLDYKGVQWEGTEFLGDRGFGESQWDEGATYEDITTEGGLQRRRAALQPWTDQLGNAVTQMVLSEAVGGTIEGAGYLLDWEGMYNLANGTEKEYTNWFSELGSSLKESVNDATQIHERAPGTIDMSDSAFWFKNSVSVASTLSIMIPGMAGAKALRYGGKILAKGAAKVANKAGRKVGLTLAKEAAENGVKLGARTEWMADGITQAVVSRHIENTMEAKGTMDGIMEDRMAEGVINPFTGKPFTELEAKEDASKAAAENYQKGWAMIGQDLLQYLSIGKVFNPITKQMEVAGKLGNVLKKVSPGIKKGVGVAASFTSEAAEEGYQAYISQKASLQSDLEAGLITHREFNKEVGKIFDQDETKISMMFGGLGGGLFDFAGPKVNKLFKSKSRKELEANAEEWNKLNFAQQFAMYQGMNKAKQDAESRGDAAGRQMAQDNIMTSMIIDGIENDNLEEVMEAIAGGDTMSAEELAAFEETHGEWDQALAKEGAARALEMAAEIKELHFKNTAKKSNRGVDRSIIKAQTLAEFQNKKLTTEQKALKKENRERMDNISYDENNNPSDEWKSKKESKTNESAQNSFVEVLTHLHKNASNKRDKAAYGEQLKIAKAEKRKIRRDNKSLEKKEKESLKERGKETAAADKEAMKDMTPKQKEQYLQDKTEDAEAKALAEKNNEDAWSSQEGEMLQGSLNEKINGMQVALNNKKVAELSTKEYQAQTKKDRLLRTVDGLSTEAEAKAYKKMLSKDEFVGREFSEEERAALNEAIDKQVEKVKRQKKAAEQAEKNAKIAEDLQKKTADKNNNPAEPDNNVEAEVTDILEDQHGEEEIEHDEAITNEQETTLSNRTGNGKSFAPLDNSDLTTKAYSNWLLNGVSKLGQVVLFRKAQRGAHMNPKIRATSDQYKAILELDTLIRNNKKENAERTTKGLPPVEVELTDFIIDNYPLEMVIQDGSENGDKKKRTGLARKDSGSSAETDQRYDESTRPERTAILQSLSKGVEPTSVIKHSGGGELQTETNSDGTPKENSIKDLDQFKDNPDDIELVYSNERGELMTSDKEDIHPEFPATQLTAGKDEEDNSRPYSGGVFLVMKKADGTSFPVKLNMMKNTESQADVLTTLLLDITIPTGKKGPDGKHPPRKYSMQTSISELDAEMKLRVETAFGPELEMLSKDATLSDLLGMVTFLSDKTEGMNTSLIFKGNQLHFGPAGEYVSFDNMEETKDKLYAFLLNTKRRPFSLERWNNTRKYPGYRNYVLNNRIINTDVVTEGPAFKSSTPDGNGKVERRVQVYTEPLAPKNAEQSVKGKGLAKVTEDVDGDNHSTELERSTPAFAVESAKEIKAEFPGKFYHMGLSEDSNGVTIDIMNNPVPADVVKKVNEIKAKWAKKGKKSAPDTKVAAETNPNQKFDDAVTSINKQIKDLRDTVTGEISKENNAQFKKLQSDLVAAQLRARRGFSTVPIGTKARSGGYLMGEEKAAEDKQIEDHIKMIERNVKSGKITIEKGLQMINLRAGKNYAFLQNEQDLINGYLRDRLDDTLPKIGNNKSSWQMFRDGIQPTTQAKENNLTTKNINDLVDLFDDIDYKNILVELSQAIKEDGSWGGVNTPGLSGKFGANDLGITKKLTRKDHLDIQDALVKKHGEKIIDESYNPFSGEKLGSDLFLKEDEYGQSRIKAAKPVRVEDVSFDDEGRAEVTYSTKQEAIDDVRADMDFRTARINEAARSGALSIEDAATQRRAATASYVSGLANIESQYAVKESKVEETKPEPKKEEKSIEMDSLEATDPGVQFNLFEDSWDATVDGKTIASGVSKEEAVSKTTEHKEASKKLEDGYVSVTHSTGGKNRTYTVYLYEGGTIRNSNGNPIYENNGKIRTAILAKAEENRSKLEKSLEPILPLELSDQEWADFSESGSVSEDRLRALVAKEESGAIMDLKEQTILGGKLGRIEEGKGNVSKSSDTEISNTKKKEVSSPGNTQSRTKGTGINMSAGNTGATRMSKKEKKAAAAAAKVTKEQINGAVIPGKEDTEGC